jgi:hypothetical protein
VRGVVLSVRLFEFHWVHLGLGGSHRHRWRVDSVASPAGSPRWAGTGRRYGYQAATQATLACGWSAVVASVRQRHGRQPAKTATLVPSGNLSRFKALIYKMLRWAGRAGSRRVLRGRCSGLASETGVSMDFFYKPIRLELTDQRHWQVQHDRQIHSIRAHATIAQIRRPRCAAARDAARQRPEGLLLLR